MTPEQRVRGAIQWIVGITVGYTVSHIVKNNTDPQTQAQKAGIVVGGTMLGLMAHEQAERYIQRRFDRFDVDQIAKANNLS